jgi:hypothetical protein
VAVVSEQAELVPWLRAQVQARLDLARECSQGSDGHWWRRTHVLGDGTAVPVGALYEGAQLLDWDGEPGPGEWTVVYDEGSPGDAQFEHIAGNDPRDTIARCESELAVLDAHDEAWRLLNTPAGQGHLQVGRAQAWRSAVRHIGYAYRHRPGYLEAWKPTG